MNLPNRAARMESLLRAAFAPQVLEIDDESALHAGHGGARSGGETHYHVRLTSAQFKGLTKVAQHRAVYSALASEMTPDGIHALALETSEA